MRPQHIVSCGRRVRVWVGGRGPTLLLLHGGLGDAHTHWAPVFDLLCDRYTLLAPDLPGFGASDPLPQPCWLDLLQWLEGVQRALTVERVTVIGNSFGGALARAYGANRPQLVRRVVLINGGMVPSPPPWLRWLLARRWIAVPMNALLRWVTYSRFGLSLMVHQRSILTKDFLARCQRDADAFVAMMAALGRSEPPPSLRPAAPTRLLWGERDRFSPPRIAFDLAHELSEAAPSVIADCGHMPQLEHTKAFVAHLESCLEDAP